MANILIDQFNRKIDYIRVSVTDRCDFRCIYCMSEKMTFLPKENLLSLEEIARIIKIFSNLGVDKVRITGGEPLVRRNIEWLFQTIGKYKSLNELTLTTNGSQLKKNAAMLKKAGVKRINISLDSLNPNTFKEMTRIGKLKNVLEGIQAAIDAKFEKIKINAVIMQGINDHELYDLVDYSIKQSLDISFIEEMPLGATEYDRETTCLGNDVVLERLQQKYSLLNSTYTTSGPARYWEVQGTKTKIGLISPHTHNFCDNCNRVRISCKGELFLCLGQEEKIELMPLIRNFPYDDEPIAEAIINSMKIKPKSHTFDLKDKQPAIVRFMSHTGG
ncbi:MAG: GTP 3',8-cyclase MoaA [Methylophilaceae bacterium]